MNTIYDTRRGSISGGQYISLTASNDSFGGGGFNNKMDGNNRSGMIGGSFSCMTIANDSIIMGGVGNVILGSYGNRIYNSSIIGGSSNIVSCLSNNSIIMGGCFNSIIGDTNQSIVGSSIIGGECNKISCRQGGAQPTNSVVIGGRCNYVYDTSNRSAIVGGQLNQIRCSNDTVIIGGSGLVIYQLNCAVVAPSIVTSYPSGGNQPTPPDLGGKFNIGCCVVSGTPYSVSTYCWISANIGGSYVRIAILQ
jgi:hypothetical protein